MALRYLARRVGIPALRRASGPRVLPSARSGPLASRSSQAGYSNGDAAWKMKNGAEKEIDEVAEMRDLFKAAKEAVEHAKRMEKLKWRFFMGSGVVGVGLGLYAFTYFAHHAAVVLRK